MFDLDDTLLQAYGRQDDAWLAVTTEFAAELAPLSPHEMTAAILAVAKPFWRSDDRQWRLRIVEARQEIVRQTFVALQTAGKATPSSDVARRLADRFSAYRNEQMCLFPDAHAVVDALRARGVLLGLITNGAGEIQRTKLKRFDLASRFDHIQIEGEQGFGKPEERSYKHALNTLGVEARETWMVGDNLEWEVAAPQRLGIHAIWIDHVGNGLPVDTAVKPDRIVRKLSELL